LLVPPPTIYLLALTTSASGGQHYNNTSPIIKDPIPDLTAMVSSGKQMDNLNEAV